MQTANQSLASLVHEARDHARDGDGRLVEPRRAAGHDQRAASAWSPARASTSGRARRGRWRGKQSAGAVIASVAVVQSKSTGRSWKFASRSRRQKDRPCRILPIPAAPAPDRPSAGSVSPTRWTRQPPRCGASRSVVTKITPAKAGKDEAAKKEKVGKIGKKVAAKNLAVFTRQFSVMIDAGLPLVQCLDILGTQEEDKNFAAVILDTRTDGRVGRVARRRDAQAPEDLRSAVHQHDRRRRGGRYPRHDSQAARDLHRKGGQAGRAGEVGDDLSDRRHRHRRRRRRRHSVEGHPDLRLAVLGPRRRPAAADARRHRAQQQPRLASSRSCSSAPAPPPTASRPTTRPTTAAASIDAIDAEGAGARQHHAQDRGRAVLPDAVDADQLGRADSRRPGNHGEDRRQLDHRRRDHGDAQEHRARRDHLGAAEGDRRCSRRW